MSIHTTHRFCSGQNYIQIVFVGCLMWVQFGNMDSFSVGIHVFHGFCGVGNNNQFIFDVVGLFRGVRRHQRQGKLRRITGPGSWLKTITLPLSLQTPFIFQMLQYRRSDPSRRRRILRDRVSAVPRKGIAGIRSLQMGSPTQQQPTPSQQPSSFTAADANALSDNLSQMLSIDSPSSPQTPPPEVSTSEDLGKNSAQCH